MGLSLVNFGSANFVVNLPYITIKSDGSVEPETEFINRVGVTYFLTANLSQYAIKIQCSNIIFDGKGHCINGTVSSGGLGYGNNGLSLAGVTNVTVMNVEVTGFMDNDLSLENCYNCTILNVKTADFELADSTSNAIIESDIFGTFPGLLIRFSHNNTFCGNKINTFDIGASENNTFFANDFLSLKRYHIKNEQNYWDNASVGNYWIDYSTKYSDASEIGDSGIGNTPYVIDADNIDNYPLMMPFETLPTSTQESQAEVQFPLIPPKEETQPNQPSPTLIVITTVLAAATLAGAGFAFYFKKHRIKPTVNP
jgi:hypothetical protein